MADSPYFCRLTHEGVLAIRGVDATKFLQGQVTCNLNYLADDQAGLGGRCTPKGRLVSSFRIVKQPDGYLLALARELVEPQLADLKKYAVFSKSVLADESAQWQRLGLNAAGFASAYPHVALAEQANGVAPLEGGFAIRLEDGRVEAWLAADTAVPELPEETLDTWLLAQVRAGVGQVFGATRELFVPQMINLQALDGVSFRKGCYTGQEIVARMQYLGKLKRRLYRLASSGEAPAVGTELFSPVHGSSVGEVVLAASSTEGCELLAVLQGDAVEDGRIMLGSSDGANCRLLDLPYSLDSDREIKR
ncbi:aminomethyltransferase [Pseudomonas oryzihabitans]|uniref:CAF17-like 4Fe-4S cluster assembly/insertion protein YgfZ n=1 Tax=Pseudomonas rhizoryzae TaxID=2571129 RepID=UPI000736C2FA|nr:folate-binding protein YgfZ [Pseudomonas rhizoryzae]APQ13502.1 folate-binding protein YgfZ [Pseudomonas psychrotolerans]KTS77915.1 aminomethyltransferase [Pseudomonas psychrotolerans]KTT07565.1 aminomethyltransferase [Pseudomonas psychrotolerans]KTT29798.1 aminomethyltransferase [Pseudomonas psychrotolerans]KTT31277.1 aminomethyltransferase [Pseudomonas psychrotolerans]